MDAPVVTCECPWKFIVTAVHAAVGTVICPTSTWPPARTAHPAEFLLASKIRSHVVFHLWKRVQTLDRFQHYAFSVREKGGIRGLDEELTVPLEVTAIFPGTLTGERQCFR
jgi:hypothetical protein